MITARSKKGFTLIELMIVIAVIAILATLALYGLTGVQKGARDTQRLSLLNNLRTAMERYNSDQNGYPTGNFSQVIASLTAGNYITDAAKDPGCGGGSNAFSNATYTPAGGTSWVPCGVGNGVTYEMAAGASGYTFTLWKESNGQQVSISNPQ